MMGNVCNSRRVYSYDHDRGRGRKKEEGMS